MPNPYFTEYILISNLVDQVKFNSFLLEEVRDWLRVAMLPDADTSEEIQKYDTMLEANKKVIEKAMLTVESLKN